jgi:hypothetical protein
MARLVSLSLLLVAGLNSTKGDVIGTYNPTTETYSYEVFNPSESESIDNWELVFRFSLPTPPENLTVPGGWEGALALDPTTGLNYFLLTGIPNGPIGPGDSLGEFSFTSPYPPSFDGATYSLFAEYSGLLIQTGTTLGPQAVPDTSLGPLGTLLLIGLCLGYRRLNP